jgi:membrane protease YdiL (CAAX protease family)
MTLAYVIMYGLVGFGRLGIVSAESPFFMALFIVGSWGPTIAAILTLIIYEKGKGIGKLFSGWVRWKVGFGWYAAAVLSPFVIAGLGAFIYLVILKGTPPGPQEEITLPALGMLLFFTIFTGATGEEPGWRAFATPRLQHHLSALGASIVLGVIWALWHLPLWFLEGTPQYGSNFAPFAIGCVFLTVLFTWIFNNTGGSLAMASLFHFSINLSSAVVSGVFGWVGQKEFSWIQTIIFGAYAVLVVILYGHKRLSRKAMTEMPFEKLS